MTSAALNSLLVAAVAAVNAVSALMLAATLLLVLVVRRLEGVRFR